MKNKQPSSQTPAYKTSEYRSWRVAKARCRNPKQIAYARYGGKGISFSHAWDLFDNFWRDLGPKPTPAHELVRLDTRGNYCPANCVWQTRAESGLRRRTAERVAAERFRISPIRMKRLLALGFQLPSDVKAAA